MKFATVAQVFATIEVESSRNEMTKLLAELLSGASAEEARLICYFALGKMRAVYQGTKFEFGEKMMRGVVQVMLGLEQQEFKKQMQQVGDLGDLVRTQGYNGDHNLTLQDVYTRLEAFENISGVGSADEKAQALLYFLQRVDSLSACYIIRMIIGKLRLGFSEMTILDALSWMHAGNKSMKKRIEHAYNISADIGLIAQALKEGGMEAIDEISITMGVPIRPAAAERLPTAKDIVAKIGECVAEPKLDGFRLQVHVEKKNGDFEHHFFSRNLLDMTNMFPEIKSELARLPIQELIIEGEAIAYDEQTGSYLPFQETVKRRRKYDIQEMAQEVPLKLVVFDILYVNGESWLNKAQTTRQKKIHELFDGYSERILVSEEVAIHTARQLEDYFNKQISLGLEGVVVKKPHAYYQPGKRNFNWIKLKRQEEGELEDTIDAVVLGYYAGKGKRAKFGIGAFLIGVFNRKKDRFETVAKVGTGLTDDKWRELKQKCDVLAVDEPPKNVVVSKELAPTVWVVPELVVVVQADEITESPAHTAAKTENKRGYALRFPRFIEFCSDKRAIDATTVTELKRLFEDQRPSS